VDIALDTGGVLAQMWMAAAVDASPGRKDLGPNTWIPSLRRAIGRLGAPDDGPIRIRPELAVEVAAVNEHRLQARYADLAHAVPPLLDELARAEQKAASGQARRDVAELLVLALRAADGVAFKFGCVDLSARLVDHMWTRALISEDPVLVSTAAYVRTETFFVTGDLDTAHRALVSAIDSHPTGSSDPESEAARGALHMRAAVVEARAGRADTAAEHLIEARQAAAKVPEAVYRGTAFGPASLRIHELAVAAELHEPAGVEHAAHWHPPHQLPAERRSHYYIELARAQLDLGHHQEAHQCLRNARRIAPQHTRQHPQVRRTLAALLHTAAADKDLAEFAEWARAG
jgi:hypothetical protein